MIKTRTQILFLLVCSFWIISALAQPATRPGWVCVPGEESLEWECGPRSSPPPDRGLPDLPEEPEGTEPDLPPSLLDQPLDDNPFSDRPRPPGASPRSLLNRRQNEPDPLDPNSGQIYSLQLAAVSDQESVRKFADDFELNRNLARQIVSTQSGETQYLVIYGRFTSEMEARIAANQLPPLLQAMQPQAINITRLGNPPLPIGLNLDSITGLSSTEGPSPAPVQPQASTAPVAVPTDEASEPVRRQEPSQVAVVTPLPDPAAAVEQPSAQPEPQSVAEQIPEQSAPVADEPAPQSESSSLAATQAKPAQDSISAQTQSTADTEEPAETTATSLADSSATEEEAEPIVVAQAPETTESRPTTVDRPANTASSIPEPVTDTASEPVRQTPVRPAIRRPSRSTPAPRTETPSNNAVAHSTRPSSRPQRSSAATADSRSSNANQYARDNDAFAQLPDQGYTIQLGNLPANVSVDRYVQRYRLNGKDLYLLTYSSQGKSRRTMLAGWYSSLDEANQALAQLPSDASLIPWVRRVKPLKALIAP